MCARARGEYLGMLKSRTSLLNREFSEQAVIVDIESSLIVRKTDGMPRLHWRGGRLPNGFLLCRCEPRLRERDRQRGYL